MILAGGLTPTSFFTLIVTLGGHFFALALVWTMELSQVSLSVFCANWPVNHFSNKGIKKENNFFPTQETFTSFQWKWWDCFRWTSCLFKNHYPKYQYVVDGSISIILFMWFVQEISIMNKNVTFDHGVYFTLMKLAVSVVWQALNDVDLSNQMAITLVTQVALLARVTYGPAYGSAIVVD